MRCQGLNSPSRVLLWVRVQDLGKSWEEFRDQLRGWRDERDGIEGTRPLITNVLAVGDNFYTVENLVPEDFGTWCRAMMQMFLHPPRVFTLDIDFA